MHIADAQTRLVHEFGQILSHPLGQCRDERAVALHCDLAAFVDTVLHLIFGRANFNGRVDQPGRADHLFGKHACDALHLPIARRRADIGRLRAHRIPFVEAERTVIDTAWQAEAIFGKREFAPVIATRHAVDLTDRDMAFIDKQQRVFGEIFEQSWRRFARHPA